ncbi:SDR family oxidoreductase [Nocardioides sp. ChNu-153]|uniref:SDR family oxidoreductase n=1 Tax=Nocardioides sp. ChNu-153 TaxID=2779364 RepID=UPI00264F1DCF|nr:SDR family oxidoreductase [Nocardioides sp. ChNu-153]MDN7122216.1 SDR family oxidoreductase [Nocardioides sp. ChNu-153]
MARIAVVGGNGQIARHLHPLLVAAGHTPVALVRTLAYAPDLEALGAEVRELDIENSTTRHYTDAMTGVEAVVFAAGGGPDGKIERKRTVDLGGALGTIAGAREAGVRRVVQISAIGVDQPVPDDTEPVWKEYVAAKRDADKALRASGLDWTIIRPGGLTDDPPTGSVTLASEVERSTVTRADVAAVVAVCLGDARSVGRQWELVNGPSPIAEAVATAE